jgi:hypothetical protein
MLTSDKLKQKTCKSCGKKFKPFSSLQKVCSAGCSISFVQEQERKEARKEWDKETRKRKEKLKTRNEWIKDTQEVFNKYIRLRDKDLPCISCNSNPNDKDLMTGSRWDCGHYRSRGSAPELRYEELNCAKQCVKCNRELSGNSIEYRKGLLVRIGKEKLDWLEGPHEPKKYTINELKELKQIYKDKIKSLNEG